jgi:hypothetical protein
VCGDPDEGHPAAAALDLYQDREAAQEDGGDAAKSTARTAWASAVKNCGVCEISGQHGGWRRLFMR